jgi:5S rRNA maturation endonuclease (ribonuclease M5)
MPNQASKSRSTDYARLNALVQLVCYRLDELFEKLDIDLRRSGKMYIGCCPVHCGDNYSALNLYPEGYTSPGIWRCNTRHCERVFEKTIIGFVRGVLSQRYFGWSCDTPKENVAPFEKVLDWLCKFVEKDWNVIQIDERTVEINKFANQIQTFNQLTTKNSGAPRSVVRKHLQIPASYYIERGYRPDTLDYFDVGLCITTGKEMFGRVVVPFYDDNGKLMVGCTARSIFSQCNACGLYHNPESHCPDRSHSKWHSKWRHNGNTGSVLYNWWNAKSHIKDSACAVLVEGPGDVWRLHEAGVENAVAMFGSDLTDEQQIILERSGAMKLYIVRDNDAAGEIAESKLREQLCRSYKLRFIVPSAKDVGEMTVEQVKQEIVPCLN